MLDAIHKKSFAQKLPSRQIGRRKSRFRYWLAGVMFVFLLGGIFIGSKFVGLAQQILQKTDSSLSFGQLFLSGDKKLTGEDEGEIRILLMGIGGAGHEGGTLTDTMILTTIKMPESKDDKVQVGMVSIPRDFNAYIAGYEYRKINSAYAFGELTGEGNGAKLAIQTVENVIGKKIPYYAVIDFQGFKKIIDDLSGIDIDVPFGFTDSRYPDGRAGYLAPITFEPGKQTMDGERALQYVRSRYGNNDQGSDFARSKRQQLVLRAIADEIKSLRVLTNLSLINKLLDGLASHFRTNIAIHEMKRLYDITKGISSEEILTNSIDGESGLVCDHILEESGAYILLPCLGLAKYDHIRDFINNQFVISPVREELAKIEIQNATAVPLLAQRVEQFIRLPGLETHTSNLRSSAKYLKTIIYDNTSGEKNQTRDYLKNKLSADVAGSPFPFPTASDYPDFVIVITSEIENILP